MTSNGDRKNIISELRKLRLASDSAFIDGLLTGEAKLDHNICAIVQGVADSAPFCDITVTKKDTASVIPNSDLEEYVGDNVKFSTHVPRTKSQFFAKNISDLTKSGFSYETPEIYYIYETDELSFETTNRSIESERYIAIINFLKVLIMTESFDHKDSSIEGYQSLLFLSPKRKLDLKLTYNFDSITVEPIQLIEATNLISLIFSDNLRQNDKTKLFKATIIDFLCTRQQGDLLDYLLNSAKHFSKTFEDNYELFISEFSFEDELDRIHEERRAFTSRLNDLMSGIQNKLFTIPLSFLVSGSQLQPTETYTEIISNTLILIGTLVFVLIMHILIENQLVLLKAVRKEFSAKKVWLLQNLPKYSKQLTTDFDSLEEMSQNISKNLKVVRFFSTLAFAFTAVLFSFYLFA